MVVTRVKVWGTCQPLLGGNKTWGVIIKKCYSITGGVRADGVLLKDEVPIWVQVAAGWEDFINEKLSVSGAIHALIDFEEVERSLSPPRDTCPYHDLV